MGEYAAQQPYDASPGLGLVRQYGTKRYMHGRSSLGRLDDVQQYEAEADVTR